MSGIGLFVLACVFGSVIIVEAQNREPVQILTSEMHWLQNPALPAGGLLTVVVGAPLKPERYLFRLSFPKGYEVMPHSHPEERIYTVLEGSFEIGIGEKFELRKLKSLPPGAVFVLPANVRHFHAARSGPAIVQVSGTGPTATIYVDPAHDPRQR